MSAYRTERAVRVRYELDAQEQAAAQELESRGYRRATIASVSAAMLVAVAILAVQLPPIAAAAAIVVLVVLVARMCQKLMRRTDRQLVDDPRWESIRDVELEVTDEGFRMTNGLSSTRMSWEVVAHFSETPDTFRVYAGPLVVHTIPKRVLGGADGCTTMRQLLTDNVTPKGESAVRAGRRTSWIPYAAFFVWLALLVATFVEAIARSFSG